VKKAKLMPSWNPKEIAHSDQDAARAMAEYGITYVPVPCFHYKSFRYSNLEDAIAQARRDLVRKSAS
jgi:hypothetical protein